ncbi:MAG: adenosylmethionine decarboxylase [Alphaproteobacteria bacterium]|nr:adenosylmethionine decarboxylase [Alphaproteobacteria bacterium]
MITPGKHLLIDFWGSRFCADKKVIEKALKTAAETCGATILKINLHEYGEGFGITGVAILAESHISIHTWPEISYIALDVFMCGDCDASGAVEPLKKIFEPKEVKISEHFRGKR